MTNAMTVTAIRGGASGWGLIQVAGRTYRYHLADGTLCNIAGSRYWTIRSLEEAKQIAAARNR